MSIKSNQTHSTQESEKITTKSNISINHRDLWNEINKEVDDERKELDDYKKSNINNKEICLNPAVNFLDSFVFPVLNAGLISMLQKAREDDCLYRPKSTFDGIDFLCEYLYNENERHPERKNNWVYIFDTDWAIAILKKQPRPFFPWSRIWTPDFATLKIQAFMRGYWVRRREDVQEMRQFWKEITKKSESSIKMKIKESVPTMNEL